MSLTEFLLARIAEDEAVARSFVAEGPWQAWASGDVSGPRRDDEYAQLTIGAGRVLAECEAKRAIAELHRLRVEREWMNPLDGPAYQADETYCVLCGWVRQGCETVRNLATVYVDHPDYDDAWRP